MKSNFNVRGILILGLVTALFTTANGQDLPSDFPVIHTETFGEPDSGHIFLNVSVDIEGVGYYVMIVNNEGDVIKYRKLEDDYSYDFKMQPSGLMSYAQFISHHSYTGGGNVVHMIVDDELNIVDSLQLKNGYVAEAHDFQLLPNGHMLAFGYYLTRMDLSDVVKDGYPNAMVSGGIIQELDQDKEVVWQWRSWDYYNYKTYPFGTRRVNRATVSKFHLNTIEIDPEDDHILLASPSWSKKINRQTGEVMWVLGGAYNEFSFVGVDSTDGTGMVTGHTFHRIDNGNFLIFDNSDRQRKRTARFHEFQLDEENKIATHIRTIEPDQFISAWHRGSAQKLDNGNYFAGWGGALTGDTIPAATEYDTAGNKIFELSFNHPAMESYRAVRHRYPAVKAYESIIAEVAIGNEYEFLLDTVETGIGIKIGDFSGSGYNEVKVDYYEYAPKYPEFPGRAPMVLAKKVILGAYSITGLKGDLVFDAATLNIKNPERITVYNREFADNGLFVPLTTTYNNVTSEIKAEFTKMGEFIFAYPDREHVVFPAMPVLNANGEIVDEESKVKIEWAPQGFFNSFDLQVSENEEFTDLIVDENGLKPTIYELDDLEINTEYFWRVKTTNDAGTSEWSDTGRFVTYKPYVELTSPNGGEVWQRGLDYFIQWNSNDTGMVVLDLYKDMQKILVIDTVENSYAHKWEVPSDLDSACGYHVEIRTLHNEQIRDKSDSTFAMNDSSCQSIELPFIEIITPYGGEEWAVGEEYILSWNNNIAGGVSVELFAGTEMISVLSEDNVSGQFIWLIPALDPELEYTIKVSGEGEEAMSRAVTIVDPTSSRIHNGSSGLYKIYPNPAENHVNIVTGGHEFNVKIYTIAGTLLMNVTNQSTIHTGSFSKGIYLMEITVDGETAFERLILK
jgi:hypothetical protein